MDMFAEVCFEKLGISTDSTLDEIKNAYRRIIKELHPDLVEEQEREKAEKKTIKLREYYEYLCKNYERIQNYIKNKSYSSSAEDEYEEAIISLFKYMHQNNKASIRKISENLNIAPEVIGKVIDVFMTLASHDPKSIKNETLRKMCSTEYRDALFAILDEVAYKLSLQGINTVITKMKNDNKASSETETKNRTAKKILIGNYKGGVGKTTSAYQIALALSAEGEKVLLIDLDPQSSLTEICFTVSDEMLGELPEKESLNYILYSQARDSSVLIKAESIIKTTGKVDFIPSDLYSCYGGLDTIAIDYMNNSIDKLLIIRNFIENNELNKQYDYIFFDSPPSDNIITRMAFLYCDYYFIPTKFDRLSARGVKHYIKTIQKVYEKYCTDDNIKKLFGYEPKLIGILETMNKSIIRSDPFKFAFEDHYVFKTIVRHHVRIAEATGRGESPDYNGSKDNDYYNCMLEMIERISKLEGHSR